MRRLQKYGVLVGVGALVLAGCGTGEVLGPPDNLPEPLIQVSSEGGFVPVDFNIARGPTFTVTRDRTFIFPGITTLEYPGALIPATFEGQLSEEQYDRIIELIAEMDIENIDDGVDNSVNNVADATTEVIKYWDENGIHKYSVYALGITDQPQSDATAAFAELFDYLHQLSGSLTGSPFQAEKFRVVASPSYAELDPNFIDIRPWPFSGENPHEWPSLTTVGDQDWTCKAFAGSTINLLDDAKQNTLWMDPADAADAQNIQLLVRPLHPGEEECSLG
jgi:hypothetical protein